MAGVASDQVTLVFKHYHPYAPATSWQACLYHKRRVLLISADPE